MGKIRIREDFPWEKKRCPYCFEVLDKSEVIKRKLFKTCKCKRCKKLIKECLVKL